MPTDFEDVRSVTLTDVLPRGTTVSSETLRSLNVHLRRVRSTKRNVRSVAPHCNARPDTSVRTTQAITGFGWTVLPQTSYSPDLRPSKFHLNGPNDEAL